MKIKSIIGLLFIVVFCPTLLVGQTTISIPDGVGTLGVSVPIPILLDVDTNDDVLGVHVVVKYNTEELEFIRRIKTESISDSLTTAVNDQEGTILISLAGIHPIQDSGVLIFLEFNPLSIGSTALSIEEYRINENESVFPDDETFIKIFDVTGNQNPAVVQIPDTLSFTSGDTLSIAIDENLFIDPEDRFEDLIVIFSITPDVVELSYNSEIKLLEISTVDYVGFATLSVRVEDLDGGFLEFEIVLDIEMKVSNENLLSDINGFQLTQNYPNPFNPSTNISYQIPKAGNVLLEVYSLNGQLISTLVNKVQSAGSYTVRFDASGLASGIYLYKISGVGISAIKKMMLIK